MNSIIGEVVCHMGLYNCTLLHKKVMHHLTLAISNSHTKLTI